MYETTNPALARLAGMPGGAVIGKASAARSRHVRTWWLGAIASLSVGTFGLPVTGLNALLHAVRMPCFPLSGSRRTGMRRMTFSGAF